MTKATNARGFLLASRLVESPSDVATRWIKKHFTKLVAQRSKKEKTAPQHAVAARKANNNNALCSVILIIETLSLSDERQIYVFIHSLPIPESRPWSTAQRSSLAPP